MKQKRTILRYYKRRLYGGRSILARAVDFLALRCIALLACYFWFSTLLKNTVLSWLLSAIALGIICVAAELYKSIRLEKFMQKERKALKERAFYERLLTMPRQEYSALIREHIKAYADEYKRDCLVYPLQQAANVTQDTVLSVYRAAQSKGCSCAVIFTISEPDKAAEECVRHYAGIPISFHSALLLANDNPDMLASDEDLDALLLRIIADEAVAHKKAVSEPFKSIRIRRYILVALALFLASFFVKYTLYYRLLAAACISFGAIAWWIGAFAHGSKQLDNR
ncbi:MAG: hypothetical protein RR527_02495 [Clostridia bacterium]